MKKFYSIIFAALLIAFSASIAFAGVSGTAHDLSAYTGTGGQVCVVCHAPHNAESGLTEGLLWNHTMPTSTYVIYADVNGTLDGAQDAQPTGHSKLCLSCHDGTVAFDAYGGSAGTTSITSAALLGTDLRDDHPVSIIYPDDVDLGIALASGVTLGFKPLSELLEGYTGAAGSGKLQCSTCHDVHNEDMTPTSKFLREPIAGSVICGKCHDQKL